MNQSKLFCLISFGILSSTPFCAFSQDSFRSELSVSSVLNNDKGDFENDNVSGTFRWYADSVSTDLGPWSILPFLSKTSFYEANYSYSDSESFDYSSRNNNFRLSGRQFLSSNTFINVDYSQQRNKIRLDFSGFAGSDTIRSYEAGVGAYLTDTSTLEFNILDTKNTKPVYALDYENVFLSNKSGFSHGFNASVSYSKQEGLIKYSSSIDEQRFSYKTRQWWANLGYSLFPSKDLSFSVNAFFRHSQGDLSRDNDVVGVNIGSEYFFNPMQSLSLRTNFSLNTPDDFFEASEVIAVGYKHRF